MAGERPASAHEAWRVVSVPRGVRSRLPRAAQCSHRPRTGCTLGGRPLSSSAPLGQCAEDEPDPDELSEDVVLIERQSCDTETSQDEERQPEQRDGENQDVGTRRAP